MNPEMFKKYISNSSKQNYSFLFSIRYLTNSLINVLELDNWTTL